ncbi:MAG: long-chain fatty acid--CoA ligase, partial [Clostridia bacterium]|nr:long-chain fatty acid--CoA ligase [Clostridia bacterium]
ENDRIVAEVFPNKEYCSVNGISDIEGIIKEKVKTMNSTAKASHIIAEVRMRDIPFDKTPSGKLKRKETVVAK